jgi:hypothetical protein
MPLYEYSDPDTGVTVELKRRIEDRDRPIVLTRTSTIPARIGIHGLGPTQEQQFNSDILRGYYTAEQREGTRLDTGEFTKEQIKQAWSE